MRTRAVVFDFFGTLTPTVIEMTTKAERVAMGAALGVDPDELEARWRGTITDRYTGRTGDLTATLRTLATSAGGTPTETGLAEAARVRSAAYRRTATLRPDTVAVLNLLRDRGMRLAVISDCSVELVAMWPELPLVDVLDTTVFSAVVGRRKPDPVMYELACTGLDVSAEDCLYVGDGGSGELTGAAAAGMRPVLLADRDWAIGHRHDADDWHGESIHELADVPNLL